MAHTNGPITYSAGSTFERYRLVNLVGGKLWPCDPGEEPLGVSASNALAVDDHVGVNLLNGNGTIEIMATGAVAEGELLIPAAAGQVAKDPGTGTRIIVGKALTSVGSGGGVIEVLPYGYGHTLTAA